MTDRRLSPDPDKVDRAEPARIVVPVADLLSRPSGPRDRQLLFGEDVTILGQDASCAYIRAEKDGYHGFIAPHALGAPCQPTHRISAAATHIYSEPDLKSPDRMWLSFGSRITVTGESGKFVETAEGFVPVQHVAPSDRLETEPVSVAEIFLGTPYLWAGNSRAGIDCSGLVQAAWLACGLPCPGDSDLQMSALGQALPESTPPQRNDLFFWKGHVAVACDEDTLIHANAGYMAVVFEPVAEALARIGAQGDGPLLSHKRP